MKNKKKQILVKNNSNQDIVKAIKIMLIVLVVFGLVYLVTALATGEISLKDKKEEAKDATIQYEEIISGESLNRADKEYYVLYLKFTDYYASTILSIKDKYEYLDDSLKIYIVDMDKAFNQSIIALKDENIIEKPKTINELKIEDKMTLLKVTDGKVTKRVKTYEIVKKYLNELADKDK